MSDLPLRNVLLGIALGIGLLGYGFSAIARGGPAAGSIAIAVLGLAAFSAPWGV